MHSPDYPLRFVPIYQERLWGGDLHKNVLGAPVATGAKIGESWEISDRPNENSVVANGPWAGTTLRALIEKHPEALLGIGHQPAERFPLLIKFIGAADRLSLQVHPRDEYARVHHPGELGKTEMWYILENQPGAELLIGFKKPQTLAEAKVAVMENRFEQLVNAVRVKPDDAFFLPAGRVHGIGAGVLLAEIQENSDVTYRVYDYGRRDEKGAPRALHIEQALAVMDFADTADGRLPVGGRREEGNLARPLVVDEHFLSEHITYEQPVDGKVHAGFQIAIATQGEGRLVYHEQFEELKRGTVLLLPAGFKSWKIVPGKSPLGILWAWVADK
jgi:mannose-6-phosphate isomerase